MLLAQQRTARAFALGHDGRKGNEGGGRIADFGSRIGTKVGETLPIIRFLCLSSDVVREDLSRCRRRTFRD